MNTLDFLRAHGTGPGTVSVSSGQDKVTPVYTPLSLPPPGEGVKHHSREHRLPSEFSNLAGKVRVTVQAKQPKGQFTAEFAAAEGIRPPPAWREPARGFVPVIDPGFLIPA
jgi:hypothetical protein